MFEEITNNDNKQELEAMSWLEVRDVLNAWTQNGADNS